MGKDQKNAFLAVILSAIVLFAWQAYFQPQVTPQVETVSQGEAAQAVNASANTSKSSAQAVAPIEAETPEVKLASYVLRKGDAEFSVTNNLFITDAKSSNAVFDFASIVGAEKPFQIRLLTNTGSEELIFNITQESDSVLSGLNEKYGISLTINISDDSKLFMNLKSNNNYKYRLAYTSIPGDLENRQVRNYLTFTNEVDRVTVGDDSVEDGKLKWSAIDFNFHIFAVVLDAKTTGRFVIKENGAMNIDLLQETNNFNAYAVFAKKNYDTLTHIGDKLNLSVDFGVFGIIAVPILRGLQWVYSVIPNYGIAIILLTLIIRMLTFPLQYKSFKSMKKMQTVQPQLAKLKEKYKDDPKKMQQETMALFKKAGANPLGGCLPMIAQMPFFFAFYQVLYNAVELVNAPFAFWITDLSIKDPFYVLPVLMGVVMFFQTKMNPSAGTDPTQKKVMMFMPLIFCFIMKDLPAGLNLYMIVSMGFGILQQLFVYKRVD